MIDLRLGHYADVMQDVECDAVLTDPPYGKRTHDGNRGLTERCETYGKNTPRRDLDGYTHWTPQDVADFVAFWAPRTRGWMACMTSDDLIEPYRDAYQKAGRLDFAPVPILRHLPRIVGDGPGSGAVYLMVARPREKRFLSWGSLPCWYMEDRQQYSIVQGAKSERLMRLIVGDYSRAGDLVCDPCGGGFTTALAALIEGRRAVSSEIDPATFAKAKARLERGYTPVFQFDAPPPANCGDLFNDL